MYFEVSEKEKMGMNNMCVLKSRNQGVGVDVEKGGNRESREKKKLNNFQLNWKAKSFFVIQTFLLLPKLRKKEQQHELFGSNPE